MAGTRSSPATGAIAGTVLRSACAVGCRKRCAVPCSDCSARFIPSSIGHRVRYRRRRRWRSWRAIRSRPTSRPSLFCSDALRRRLFSPNLRRELQGYHAADLLKWHMMRCDSEDPLSQVQYADFKTDRPGDILTKVDRASMANSLEVRVPLLDHTLVEWAARLPSRLKLHGREGKYIFKAALEPHVGKQILYRPKQGFAVPLAAWFRGPLRGRLREMLEAPLLKEAGLFDMATIARLLDQHQAGERDHSAALWSLSLFEAFLRQVHGSTAGAGIRSNTLASVT